MFSGQLGTAQLGLTQLGQYEQLLVPASSPTPTIGVLNPTTLQVVDLPNYFEMMGRWPAGSL